MGQQQSISLKASVDKKNNRVIFAEADADFVDVLLSFLTMPMGTIIRLVRSKSPTLRLGCMNNLYASVENLDVERLQTKACKTMLLQPKNSAAAECNRLRLKIDDGKPLAYFTCNTNCCRFGYKLLSHYCDGVCDCGKTFNHELSLTEKEFKEKDKGVFVKRPSRLIISDELKIMPASIEASLSILSELGVMEGNNIEERNLNIGVHECSLVSKTALTESLLNHNSVPELGKESCTKKQQLGKEKFDPLKTKTKHLAHNVQGKIRVKLIVNKSKKTVCFAEASEDFVNLLFSFLTLPLGCLVKEMYGGNSKSCITHLYNSVEMLDAKKYLKSPEHKEMLLSPKLAPKFSYENNPLRIEEVTPPPYYYYLPGALCTLESDIPNACQYSTLTLADPKSHTKEAIGRGFVAGPANFTVTDNLNITPVSPVSSLTLLNKMKLSFSDIEERFVFVGTKEALRLMVTSFVSKFALTDAFLREPKLEY